MSERKAPKGIFRALSSERIVWESEPIRVETGGGMGRHGEGCREVPVSVEPIEIQPKEGFAKKPLAPRDSTDRPQLTRSSADGKDGNE